MNSLRVVFGVILFSLLFSTGAAFASAAGSADKMKQLNQQVQTGHEQAPSLKKSTQTK